MNKMKLYSALQTDAEPLRTKLLDVLTENDKFNFWHQWECNGIVYDVNFWREDVTDNNIRVIAYNTKRVGDCHCRVQEDVIARLMLNFDEWKTLAKDGSLPTHNVELTVTLRVNVTLEALSAKKAIDDLTERFRSGDLNVDAAFEHCEVKAVVTDDLPRSGSMPFYVNVFESRSKDILIYADCAADAENLVRNHLNTHIALNAGDSIGIDLTAEAADKDAL